jgi:putative IMPACT (imprinted ancient) family translation regulator
MEELAAVKLVVQRSRFFAHLYLLEGRQELDSILKQHRRSYRKANHHCFALRLGEESPVELAKDDGEVGHPGKVLLEILKKHNLSSHLLVVSRVFGGVKLGVGGVSRAFREAGEAVVEHQLLGQTISNNI